MRDEKAEPKFTPLVNYLADVFKAAWHKADELGEEGSRTRQGVVAVLAALRTESDGYTFPMSDGEILIQKSEGRNYLLTDRAYADFAKDWTPTERAVWAARLRSAANLIEGQGVRSQRVLDMFNGVEASDG